VQAAPPRRRRLPRRRACEARFPSCRGYSLQHRRRRACGVQQAAHRDAPSHRCDCRLDNTAMRVCVLAAQAVDLAVEVLKGAYQSYCLTPRDEDKVAF